MRQKLARLLMYGRMPYRSMKSPISGDRTTGSARAVAAYHPDSASSEPKRTEMSSAEMCMKGAQHSPKANEMNTMFHNWLLNRDRCPSSTTFLFLNFARSFSMV
eukprot:Lithocolla_globosa_v1_NODE_1650_length_2420_cov_9.449471.p2 type:complete len:104 gc:universal NODE_1650_length_2420_cov_9.449471:1549-1238(-)